jgi:hypothetical protein
LVALMIGPAAGQQAANPQTGPEAPAGTFRKEVAPGDPVDQTVEDLDPRSRSLRQVEPGNAQFPEHVSLYRRAEPVKGPAATGPLRHHGQARPFVYRAPGVEAFVDQPQYLTPQGRNRPVEEGLSGDRRFLQQITANTVFNLIPEAAKPNASANQSAEPPAGQVTERYRVDTRLDTRVSPRVEGRIDGRVNAPAGASRRSGPASRTARQGLNGSSGSEAAGERVEPSRQQQRRIEAAQEAD